MASKKRRKTTTNSDVVKFLNTTGFLFEMEMGKILKKLGYNVYPNETFLDIQENKERELDIVATKKLNNVKICLIIECKQSLNEDWIFICSKHLPPRYNAYVKFLPEINQFNYEKDKTFHSLHFFNKKIPLAQNYISINNGKKGNQEPIDSSLYKLPKALVAMCLRLPPDERTIIIPVILFSGKLFTVKNNKDKITVNNSGVVQFQTSLNQDIFENNESSRTHHEKINKFGKQLGRHFLIDVINKNGFKKYLSLIEKGASKIPTDKWPIKK